MEFIVHVPVAKINNKKSVFVTDKIKINNFDLNQMYHERLVKRDYFKAKDIYYGFKYMLDSLSKRLGLNKNNYNKQEKILILKYIIDQMLDVTRKHKSILLFVNLDLSPSSKET